MKLLTIPACFIIGLLVTSSAGAEDAKPAEWLFVHTAETAEMASETTLVMPVERDIFAFTDRPNRRHAYLTAEQFAGLWADAKGDSFKADPPNAVLTWVNGEKLQEAEVIITKATAAADGMSINYEIKHLVADVYDIKNFARKRASLFVDAGRMLPNHSNWVSNVTPFSQTTMSVDTMD